MNVRGDKKKGGGFILGPILIAASMGGLWQNENRFDYYEVAEAAGIVAELGELNPDEVFSYTGKMDQGLSIDGQYVQSFTGYLDVDRTAEIYAWDRDEDDDGVTWTKRWMRGLQSNERNRNLKLNQKLSSNSFTPNRYQVSDLDVSTAKIQFVDAFEALSPASLKLSRLGERQGLVAKDSFYYIAKGGGDQLGDERVSYRGLSVPETATYFGKWSGQAAVWHHAEVKEGAIASLIGDKGILHHLVAGERELALTSIKAYLQRTKNIVRGIGMVVCSIGWGILFSSMTRFLIYVPWIGAMANRLSGWIGMLLGVVIGALTIAIGFAASHPILLVGIGLLAIALVVVIWRNAVGSSNRIRSKVGAELGHLPTRDELSELEFIELAQMAESDGAISKQEQVYLEKWAKQHGWTDTKTMALLQRASEESVSTSCDRDKLRRLVSFSLADGRIDRTEMKTLERAADKCQVNRLELIGMINQLQRAA